ncbi:hypothetical protein R4Z10_02855 [Niallia sp. XMNu-256]|uniref:hypothetical protein n=1 Tax=Niallia sp. XMNu-256 TaxID=3082444 RepID=UPI0030CAF568
MTGIIAVVMVFSIPIIAIVTNHFQKVAKIRHDMIQDELKLEELKYQNYLIETEKMKLELEKMKADELIQDPYKIK